MRWQRFLRGTTGLWIRQGHFTREDPPYGGNDDNYAFTPGDITFEIWIKSVPGLAPDTYGMIFQQVGSYGRKSQTPLHWVCTAMLAYQKLRVAGWKPVVLSGHKCSV